MVPSPTLINHSPKSTGTIPPYNAMSASHFYNKQWERPNVSIPTHTHGTIPNCGWPIHHKEHAMGKPGLRRVCPGDAYRSRRHTVRWGAPRRPSVSPPRVGRSRRANPPVAVGTLPWDLICIKNQDILYLLVSFPRPGPLISFYNKRVADRLFDTNARSRQ